MEEIYDQAAMIRSIFAAHLQVNGHNGKPKEYCEFCKEFILPKIDMSYPLESYKFLILDISNTDC